MFTAKTDNFVSVSKYELHILLCYYIKHPNQNKSGQNYNIDKIQIYKTAGKQYLYRTIKN